jgi:hypothetical protein
MTRTCKATALAAMLTCLAALSACGARPVTSYGDLGVGNVRAVEKGTLVVYTRKSFLSKPDSASVPVDEPYNVHETSGRLLLKVANRDPVTGETPTSISLRPGKYLLRFEDRAEIKECVVTIEANTVSRVDMRALQKPAQ